MTTVLEQQVDAFGRLTLSGRRVPLTSIDELRASLMSAIEASLPFGGDGTRPLGARQAAQLRLATQLLARLREMLIRMRPRQERRAEALRLRDSIAGWLPIMRALDAQSRILRLQLAFHQETATADWHELLRLALEARSSTFLDTGLDDPCAYMPSATARGLFIVPVLLRLAELESRSADQVRYIDRLARQVAPRVGFAIVRPGTLIDEPQGPDLMIDTAHRVNLDSNAVLRFLSDRASAIDVPAPIRARMVRGLDNPQALALLRSLQALWAGPLLERSGFEFG